MERHSVFEDLEGLYKLIIVPFPSKVSANEDRIWNTESVTNSSGLPKKLTEAKLFVHFRLAGICSAVRSRCHCTL